MTFAQTLSRLLEALLAALLGLAGRHADRLAAGLARVFGERRVAGAVRRLVADVLGALDGLAARRERGRIVVRLRAPGRALKAMFKRLFAPSKPGGGAVPSILVALGLGALKRAACAAPATPGPAPP